jgi:hypothetical protein
MESNIIELLREDEFMFETALLCKNVKVSEEAGWSLLHAKYVK